MTPLRTCPYFSSCSTPSGITGTIATFVVKTVPPPICAQRLPASQEHSPFAVGWLATIGLVLNAFRHHRNNRWQGGSRKFLCNIVLNAFRHHRNNRMHLSSKMPVLLSAQRLPASQEQSPLAA